MCVCVYLCNRENHIVELESQMCIWTRSFERERGRKNQEQQKKRISSKLMKGNEAHTHTHISINEMLLKLIEFTSFYFIDWLSYIECDSK